jgi:hypothetical protein
MTSAAWAVIGGRDQPDTPISQQAGISPNSRFAKQSFGQAIISPGSDGQNGAVLDGAVLDSAVLDSDVLDSDGPSSDGPSRDLAMQSPDKSTTRQLDYRGTPRS